MPQERSIAGVADQEQARVALAAAACSATARAVVVVGQPQTTLSLHARQPSGAFVGAWGNERWSDNFECITPSGPLGFVSPCAP